MKDSLRVCAALPLDFENYCKIFYLGHIPSENTSKMSENTTLKFVFDEDYKAMFKWSEYLVCRIKSNFQHAKKGVKMIFEKLVVFAIHLIEKSQHF